MNRVSNNGLNELFSVLQQGVRGVRQVVGTTGRTIVENFSRILPSCTSLMRSTQPLVRVLAQSIDGNTFPELPTTPVGNMFRIWSPEYISFIQNNCMKRFEECQGNGVTPLEDPDRVFVARSEILPDISVNQAQDFGFTLPKDISERVRRNPNLMVRPLIIRCFGVGSGNFLDQLQEGARDILSLSTDRLALVNFLVLSHIESVRQRFESDPNILVIPLITGFSLGAMFARAIALRNNFPSITFNGLGLGKTGCDFVGKENWERAQQQPNSHIAMLVDHDFVASPDSPWRSVTRIPGRIVSIPGEVSDEPTLGEEREVHREYKKYFIEAHQDYLASHPHADVQLAARSRLAV